MKISGHPSVSGGLKGHNSIAQGNALGTQVAFIKP